MEAVAKITHISFIRKLNKYLSIFIEIEAKQQLTASVIMQN